MPAPDAKVFEVFGIDECRGILDLLIRSHAPLTQKQIAEKLDLRSSGASRRMSEMEQAGLVARASSHGPYELLFRETVQTMLELGADLGSAVADRAAEEARALSDERRKSRMRGNALPSRARENS